MNSIGPGAARQVANRVELQLDVVELLAGVGDALVEHDVDDRRRCRACSTRCCSTDAFSAICLLDPRVTSCSIFSALAPGQRHDGRRASGSGCPDPCAAASRCSRRRPRRACHEQDPGDGAVLGEEPRGVVRAREVRIVAGQHGRSNQGTMLTRSPSVTSVAPWTMIRLPGAMPLRIDSRLPTASPRVTSRSRARASVPSPSTMKTA